jgi:hypothetical protein
MGMIQDDPIAFVQRLMKQYASKGVTDPNDQIREIFRDFGRQTTQREVADVLMNMNQMQAEREQIKKAFSIGDALGIQNIQDIDVATHNLAASFENLKLAIGGPESERIAGVVNSLAGAMRGVTEAVRLDNELRNLLGVVGLGPGSSGIFALLNALGWLGNQGAALDGAAKAIHNVVDEITTILAKVGGWFGLGVHSNVPGSDNGYHPEADPLSAGSLFQRENFVPPPRDQKTTVLKAALNIDSRQLAEAVSYALADAFENSPNAPTANGSSLAALNGWNPVV